MGFLDALKKLLPKEEPLPWDAQSVCLPFLTVRLPAGWRFTQATWRSARALGPGEQPVEFYFTADTENRPMTPRDAESARPEILRLMGGLVKHDAGLNATPAQSVLPNGVLWTEANEVKGAERWFVVYLANLQPRAAEFKMRMAQICMRTRVPVSVGALGDERLETLRGVMRSVEWA